MTFIDLAGHEKYLKTTISGLTGCFPDYAFIVVGANMGISKMTREHIQVAIALSIPLFVVITKVCVTTMFTLSSNNHYLVVVIEDRHFARKDFEAYCQNIGEIIAISSMQ